MFVSSGTLEPLALRTSAASAQMKANSCDFRVPYTGTLTRQTQSKVASAMRRLIIEMPYGARLKGLSVTTQDQVLTVSAVATSFAIKHWVESGEFIAAVDAAVREARVTVAR
ncbi:MAG: hypothetical protein AAGC46_11040 [Solirubrobacteraceae bacterium]|nr:hypothetical protein [Patulibacter sp.]